MKVRVLLCGVCFSVCRALAATDCIQPSYCDALDYATLCDGVYTQQPHSTIGCDGVAPFESPKEDGDGFYASVTCKDGEYVVAFRGTELSKGQDLLDDLDQGLNGNNKQFSLASDYVNDLMDVLNKCNLKGSVTLTGHSLGGSLAQYAATQVPDSSRLSVIAFNPGALLPVGASQKFHGCAFNYVHPNDILYRTVNPLLREASKVDPNVAPGYIGDTIPLGPGGGPIDYSAANLTKEDVERLRTPEFRNELEQLFAAIKTFQNAPNWQAGVWRSKGYAGSLISLGWRVLSSPLLVKILDPMLSAETRDKLRKLDEVAGKDYHWWAEAKKSIDIVKAMSEAILGIVDDVNRQVDGHLLKSPGGTIEILDGKCKKEKAGVMPPARPGPPDATILPLPSPLPPTHPSITNSSGPIGGTVKPAEGGGNRR